MCLLVLTYFLVAGDQAFYQRGAETPVFHFIQSGDGTALWGSNLVNFLLRMGLLFQKQLSSPFYGLGSNKAGGGGIKSDFNTTLDICAYIAHREGCSAGTQNSRRIHQFFINLHGASQLVEHFEYFLKLIIVYVLGCKAGHAFANGNGRIRHGPYDWNLFRNDGRQLLNTYSGNYGNKDMFSFFKTAF